MTRVCSIATALPERTVSNEEMAREHPDWDVDRVARRSGVLSRHVAGPDETTLELAARACDQLVVESGLELALIDAILYCTQTPSSPIPGDAHRLHARLGLGDDVVVLDFNLACSGYVYGLAIADSFVCSGLAGEILLVTAEAYSKRTDPADRSTRMLFGDGAAVTHLSAKAPVGGQIVAYALAARGAEIERFHVPPGERDIQMDGLGVWSLANSLIPDHVRDFLGSQALEIDDIDLFVFHQASAMTLASLGKALNLPPEKVYDNLERVGNLVSASIPFALRAALDESAVEPGDRVLLCGFGAGFSFGSVLLGF